MTNSSCLIPLVGDGQIDATKPVVVRTAYAIAASAATARCACNGGGRWHNATADPFPLGHRAVTFVPALDPGAVRIARTRRQASEMSGAIAVTNHRATAGH